MNGAVGHVEGTSVSNDYPNLFAPGRMGTLRLRNRVVMAPIDSIFRTEIGALNQQHRDYLAARAAGGVGMIITDNFVIEYPRGAVGSKALRIDQDRFTASLNDLVEEVHLWDSAIVAQIAHAGRQTTLGGSQGRELVSSSAIPWEGSGTIPRELTRDEIEHFINEFVLAARRVKRAQCDGVEIHAAHGYLLSSFLSPALNHRSDEYGGSTRNRSRIVTRILEAVREEVGPSYPIMVRLNARDGIPGGLEPAEAADLGALFEEAGADALDVSAGTYESPMLTFPPMMRPEGTIVDDASRIKRSVSIPVVVVGKISTPSFADGLIADGKADFVALGRALIAEPEWTNKTRRGVEEDIRPCIACNEGCIHKIDQDLAMRCNVNPDLGREGRLPLRLAARPRDVVVVGAGPAGAEFALRASERGHRVRLFEATSNIGGQLVLAQRMEFKRDLGKLARFHARQLEKSEVDVILDTRVGVGVLDEVDPDVVVVATGMIPLVPVAFTRGKPVATWADVLEQRIVPRDECTVVGGGPTGCEIAVHLAHSGVEVTMVEEADTFAADEEPASRAWLEEQFREHGIEVQLRTRVVAVNDESITGLRLDDGSEVHVPYRNIVVAAGAMPDRRLADELNGHRPVHLIGDCRQVASVLDATWWAARLAARL